MGEGRSQLILLSVAVAESSWLFAVFMVLGQIGDLGGSPLPWISVLALLLISIFTGHMLGVREGDEVSNAIRQSLFGLVVIYILLGTGTFLDEPFNIGWLFTLLSGDLGSTASVSAVFGFLILLWLWRHGIKLGTDRYPEDRLARIFKIGIGALAIATLVDQAIDDDLGTVSLLLPFFGATLVGMAVGRLPEGGVGKRSGEWAKVIGVSVFGVMGVGLLLGLIGGLYGNGGVRLLYAGWGLVVDGFLWVLRFPVTWAIAIINWLIDLFARDPDGEDRESVPPQSGDEILGREPTEMVEAGNATVDSILNIIQYPVIALAVITAFFILAMAYRRLGQQEESDDDDERESLRSELNTAGDMSRLLGGLVPGWMRRRSGKGWRSPDESGFAEVFSLYFDALGFAVKRGMQFHPQMTPRERLPLLQAALPGAPIGELTDRFNDACYGHIPADPNEVEALRSRIEEARKAPQPD